MSYSFQNSDGSVVVSVSDNAIDNTYALSLIGKKTSGYGLSIARNTIKHLENFAGTTPPGGTALVGQLWYDKTDNIIRSWDGTDWRRIGITVGEAPIDDLTAGTAYFDNNDEKLKIYDGVRFRSADYAGEVKNIDGNTKYGTRLRNIYLRDTSNNLKPVLALVYVNSGTTNGGSTIVESPAKETIMAIFSDHPAFTVQTNGESETDGIRVNYYTELTETGGIGALINPGMNLRSEYRTTTVDFAENSNYAVIANSINAATVVDATDIIHTGRSYVPDTDNSYQLGSQSNKFSGVFTNGVYLTATEIPITNQIGTAVKRFNNLYTGAADISGSLAVSGNISSTVDPADNIHADNILVGDISIDSSGLQGNVLNSTGAVLIDHVSNEINSNAIKPITDNNSDLGTAAQRWQDLYLSGGVYIGGTSSANYLDDYEKGTFTLNGAGSTLGALSGTVSYYYGEYVKVGRVVHLYGRIGGSSLSINTSPSPGYIFLRGIPFLTSDNSPQPSIRDTYPGIVSSGVTFGAFTNVSLGVSAVFGDEWCWGNTSFTDSVLAASVTYMTDS